MALIKCYECGAMVSDKAATCPKCGAPLTKESPKTDGGSSLYGSFYTDEQPRLTFGEAIYAALIKNYANFSDRARRSEFWYYTLFQVLVSILLTFIPSPVIAVFGQPVPLLSSLFGLLTLLPNLAVGVRRLHDIDKSGWHILTPFILPFLLGFIASNLTPPMMLGLWAGYIIVCIRLFVWLCRDSSEEENEYGPSPKYPQVPVSEPTSNKAGAANNSFHEQTTSSISQVKGVSGAHLEAMRAIRKMKEQEDEGPKKEIVENIKKAHRQFLAERERRESETVEEDERSTPPSTPSSPVDANRHMADASMIHDAEQAQDEGHGKHIRAGIFRAVGVYLIFLLCLLLLGSLFPKSKGLRYYANGFYAWFGWQPFKDAPAFQHYPLVDLFGGNKETADTRSTGKSVETPSETKTMILDEFNYEKSFTETGPNGEEVRLGEFQCKLSYPKSIGGQDLRRLQAQMVEDCFGTTYAGQSFQQATQSFLKDEFQYDEDDVNLRIEVNQAWWADTRTIELTCSYDPDLNWVQYLIRTTYSPSGAAHGSYNDTYKIFDLNRQRLLNYYDLFKVEKEELQPILWNQLMTQYENPDAFWDFHVSDNISREEKEGEIYYVFHYAPYDIAPFAFGVIDIKVPSYKLSNYLRSN